jgi:hypothetical protein
VRPHASIRSRSLSGRCKNRIGLENETFLMSVEISSISVMAAIAHPRSDPFLVHFPFTKDPASQICETIRYGVSYVARPIKKPSGRTFEWANRKTQTIDAISRATRPTISCSARCLTPPIDNLIRIILKSDCTASFVLSEQLEEIVRTMQTQQSTRVTRPTISFSARCLTPPIDNLIRIIVKSDCIASFVLSEQLEDPLQLRQAHSDVISRSHH